MIVALAGRRIDAKDSETTRFPLNNIESVKEKLKILFISLEPTVLVCSAACGADLLALQVAGELNIPRSIVLPFQGAKFKTSSVTDRPGNWGNLFDNICTEVNEEERVWTHDYPQNDDETYSKTNIDILDRAKALSEKYDSKDLVAVIVWEGKPRNKNDTTEHFKKEAEKRGFIINEINTIKS